MQTFKKRLPYSCRIKTIYTNEYEFPEQKKTPTFFSRRSRFSRKPGNYKTRFFFFLVSLSFRFSARKCNDVAYIFAVFVVLEKVFSDKKQISTHAHKKSSFLWTQRNGRGFTRVQIGRLNPFRSRHKKDRFWAKNILLLQHY